MCKKHKVERLYAFGSVLNENFSEQSDIDFLVYFEETIPLLNYADNFFDFKFALEDLLQRDIDLVEGKTLKNKYFIEELNETKQLIYEPKSTKIQAEFPDTSSSSIQKLLLKKHSVRHIQLFGYYRKSIS